MWRPRALRAPVTTVLPLSATPRPARYNSLAADSVLYLPRLILTSGVALQYTQDAFGAREIWKHAI